MPRHPHLPLPPGTHVVDGLEGRVARVELQAGGTRDVPRRQLPDGTRAGDVLQVTPSSITIDREETQKRQVRAQQQLDALNAGSPAGDVDL